MADKISIHDVARKSGVSIATVSRVLNGRDRVAQSTRRKVEKAARTLNYSPNPQARALIRRRTDTLGMILPDLIGDYFGGLMQGVDKRAREAGMHLIIARASDPKDKLGMVEQLLKGGRIDGLVLLLSDLTTSILDALVEFEAPLVVLDSDVGHRPLDNILADNRSGAREATEHLITVHGLTDLLFLGGPKDNIDTNERAQGFSEALAHAGRPPKKDRILYLPSYDYDAGYRAMEKQLARMGGKSWGIVAANDDLARGAMLALSNNGLSVPDDVAVIGFDDSRLAQQSTPALTSVRTPLLEIGARAVEMLLDRLEERRTQPTVTIFKSQLVVRESCGCGTKKH